MKTVSWSEFALHEPQFAQHAGKRLGEAPCYVGTVRPDGFPRVHPVGPFALRDNTLVATDVTRCMDRSRTPQAVEEKC